jgi:GNAT superfamily N-acetyltransferase
VRRELGDGYELDDDPARIDLRAVHAYISGESYWGRGRPLELVQSAIAGSRRVVGLYREWEQVGFARAVSDGATVAYLADVYVLAPHRGRGLGLALVREILDGSPGVIAPAVRWLLHTADAQRLYAKAGFLESPAQPPAYPLMERRRGEADALARPPGADPPARAPARPASGTPGERRQ